MNKLYKAVYIKGNLKLLSSLLIGNGTNYNTDTDILRDGDGNPFIPGSSIAGVLRSFIEENIDEEYKNIVEYLFGKKVNGKEESTESCIYFYDLYLKDYKKEDVSVRDGILINEYIKTTSDKGKYDYEVINSDKYFEFKLEVLVREKYEKDWEKIERILLYIIKALENEKIRIGAKISRGLGKVKLEDTQVYMISFSDPKGEDAYINFDWQKMKEDKFLITGESFLKNNVNFEDNITRISVPLEICDTLFIRNYRLSNDDVDAEQLQNNDRLIILGTSWAGAIRHNIMWILKDLKCDCYRKIVNELFGYVNKEDAKASRIIIDESIDKQKSKFLNITRNKIDRFTGGACDKGLFQGRVAVGGNVELSIAIKNAKKYEIALVLLAIYDILNGFTAIGGETSVGRGIFKGKSIIINGKELTNDSDYMNDLAKKLEVNSIEDN